VDGILKLIYMNEGGDCELVEWVELNCDTHQGCVPQDNVMDFRFHKGRMFSSSSSTVIFSRFHVKLKFR
jgi:hypothetical protein